MPEDQLTVGVAQIAPIWLDRARTLDKIIDYVNRAADRGCVDDFRVTVFKTKCDAPISLHRH